MKFLRLDGTSFTIISLLILIGMILFSYEYIRKTDSGYAGHKGEVALPPPVTFSKISVEEALQTRRSIRTYKSTPVTLQEISQLLWAAQGITAESRFRTTPSAGALYPLELYLVAGNVEGLAPGIYHYLSQHHVLIKESDGDLRLPLYKAALEQDSARSGAADIVITGVFSRTRKKYGDRANRFVYMEAGHAAQNIYLQSVSLKLGTVSLGAFDDNQVKNLLNLVNEDPLYILPIGKI